MEVNLTFNNSKSLTVFLVGDGFMSLAIPKSKLVAISCQQCSLYFINWSHQDSVFVNVDADEVIVRARHSDTGIAREILNEIETFDRADSRIFVINTNGIDPNGIAILTDNWPANRVGVLCDPPLLLDKVFLVEK